MIFQEAKEIPPFIVMDFLKRPRAGKGGGGYPHLEVGEPDFDTPECIKEACTGHP